MCPGPKCLSVCLSGLWRAKEHAAPAFSDDGLRDLASELAFAMTQFTVKTACKKLSPLQRTRVLLFALLAGPAVRAPAASQDKQFMMCQRRARALLLLTLQPRDPRATVVQPQARIRRWCPRCDRPHHARMMSTPVYPQSCETWLTGESGQPPAQVSGYVLLTC